MAVFIFQTILIISLGGILLIIVRKIPVLITLPETPKIIPEKKNIVVSIKKSSSDLKQKFSKPKELRKKIKSFSKKDKRKEIDTDGDYWQKIKRD